MFHDSLFWGILRKQLLQSVNHEWFLKSWNTYVGWLTSSGVARTENPENPHFQVQKTFLKSLWHLGTLTDSKRSHPQLFPAYSFIFFWCIQITGFGRQIWRFCGILAKYWQHSGNIFAFFWKRLGASISLQLHREQLSYRFSVFPDTFTMIYFLKNNEKIGWF